MERLLQVRARVLDGIRATAPVVALMSGRFDPRLYARYLINVWHYAQHSSAVIGLAGSRCVRSDPALAEYLFRHALEELGHEQWALEDLAVLQVAPETVRASRPVPSCAAMIGYEYYVAGQANPVGLFGWLYVLEAMGEDLGHVVSDRVRASLGGARGIKFLKGHGEADEGHTRDLTEQIRSNVRAADLAEVEAVAEVVGDLYVRMFQEIGAAEP